MFTLLPHAKAIYVHLFILCIRPLCNIYRRVETVCVNTVYVYVLMWYVSAHQHNMYSRVYVVFVYEIIKYVSMC